MNKLNKKGFTLIEMLVVIAIIAVLVSIIVPVVSNSTAKAKGAADAANLRSVAASVAIDYLDNNEVNTAYADMADCETYPNATLEVYNNDGQIVAVFKTSSAAYGIEHFAEIAEKGSAAADFGTVTGTALPVVSSGT